MSVEKLPVLLKKVRACTICAADLPEGPHPVLAVHRDARIVVIGQAPGRRVHESGVPWDDRSGDRLRKWMGVNKATFYGPKIALVPMGFCYPGTGTGGDLPPRPECAPEWHERVLSQMPTIRLTLLLSRYALKRYLPESANEPLTETVRAWKAHRPARLPLPHPSPRNNRWLKKNPWFEDEVLPYLARRVKQILR